MKPLHKIAMVFTTLLLAAATGHVMQSAAPGGTEAPAPEPAAAAQPQPDPQSNPQPEQQLARTAEHLPALGLPPMRKPLPAPGMGPLPQDSAHQASGFAPQTCAPPQIALEPAASASVRLSLAAPCLAGQTATIHHAGLALPITLSAAGDWSGIIPALLPQARFSVALADGTTLEATQAVTGLADLNRIALVTGARTPVQLHSFEYGSGHGGAGDVNPADPRSPDTPLGGWMAVFASATAQPQVQIYTAPASMADLRLELEAGVDPASCGKDLTAEAHRLLRGVAEVPAEITLAMPDCNDGDGTVVMQLPDFPIAVATAN
jgi:hypothetical protein